MASTTPSSSIKPSIKVIFQSSQAPGVVYSDRAQEDSTYVVLESTGLTQTAGDSDNLSAGKPGSVPCFEVIREDARVEILPN